MAEENNNQEGSDIQSDSDKQNPKGLKSQSDSFYPPSDPRSTDGNQDNQQQQAPQQGGPQG
jgi:hypothetical protein